MRNFKRILNIALTLSILICFAACDKKVSEQPPQSAEKAAVTENVISMDKRFKVVEDTKDGQAAYTYTLYDSFGNVVHEQTVVREPRIKYVSENILEISNSHGTSALSCSYFDLTTNKLSEICWNPSYVDENIVVYMEYDETRNPSTFLVVKDIFDSTKKYIEFDFDFSPMAVPADAIKSVKLIDENTMELVYLAGENETEITNRVDIS